MDFLTNPFATALLFLYRILFQNTFLTIVVFTFIIRMLVFPLTWQQLKSSKAMQKVQPEMKEIREKFKGDREKQAQAQMELYRKNGVNPFAGCLPLIVQLPILLGLYGAITVGLASTPLQVLDINRRLLFPALSNLIPLNNQFLVWNLSQPDPTFVLPILVVITTWLQQKLITPPNTSGDPKDASAQMSRQMTIMMPLMIGLFSIQFAAGLSIYWIIGNIIGVFQYAILGKVDVRLALGLKKAEPDTTITKAPTSDTMKRKKQGETNAKPAAAATTLQPVMEPEEGVITSSASTSSSTNQSYSATPAKPRAKAKAKTKK